MSTSFPSGLDALSNPSSTDKLNNPSHSAQHANANDALEAIEAKVGIDGSAVTTSHDYKLSGITGSGKAALDSVVVHLTGAETITDKRITPRIGTTASSATPTPNADTDDTYTITDLAAGATFGAPAGTPTDGQKLLIRIKDNATARALAFNAIYRAVGVTLPTTTVISKTLYIGCIYNLADTKWDVIAISQEV